MGDFKIPLPSGAVFSDTAKILSSGVNSQEMHTQVLDTVTVSTTIPKKTNGGAILFGMAIAGYVAYRLFKK